MDNFHHMSSLPDLLAMLLAIVAFFTWDIISSWLADRKSDAKLWEECKCCCKGDKP